MPEIIKNLAGEGIIARDEFKVISDVLLVPLKQDIPNQELPLRRRWIGGCLHFQPSPVIL
jgi:hypothetical protein